VWKWQQGSIRIDQVPEFWSPEFITNPSIHPDHVSQVYLHVQLFSDDNLIFACGPP
jgi:hypothetical protein